MNDKYRKPTFTLTFAWSRLGAYHLEAHGSSYMNDLIIACQLVLVDYMTLLSRDYYLGRLVLIR